MITSEGALNALRAQSAHAALNLYAEGKGFAVNMGDADEVRNLMEVLVADMHHFADAREDLDMAAIMVGGRAHYDDGHQIEAAEIADAADGQWWHEVASTRPGSPVVEIVIAETVSYKYNVHLTARDLSLLVERAEPGEDWRAVLDRDDSSRAEQLHADSQAMVDCQHEVISADNVD